MAGSVIGHGISNMLFGGSRPAEAQAPSPADYAQQQQGQNVGGSCDIQAKGKPISLLGDVSIPTG